MGKSITPRAYEEELIKLRILSLHPERREEIEQAFWAAQAPDVPCHKIWSGEILPLIKWASKEHPERIEAEDFNPTKFNLERFGNYSTAFDRIFGANDLDPLRRALLHWDLKEYPRAFRDQTILSFCYEWSDWKALIEENVDAFAPIIDYFAMGYGSEDLCEMIIEDEHEQDECHLEWLKWNNPHLKLFCGDLDLRLQNRAFEKVGDDDWSAFALYPYLLEYCNQKNVQRHNTKGIILLKEQRADTYMSVSNKHLLECLKNAEDFVHSGWNVRDRHDTTVVEECNRRLAFDIHYDAGEWHLSFFSQNKDLPDPDMALASFLDTSAWQWENNTSRYYLTLPYTSPMDFRNVKEALGNVIARIN